MRNIRKRRRKEKYPHTYVARLVVFAIASMVLATPCLDLEEHGYERRWFITARTCKSWPQQVQALSLPIVLMRPFNSRGNLRKSQLFASSDYESTKTKTKSGEKIASDSSASVTTSPVSSKSKDKPKPKKRKQRRNTFSVMFHRLNEYQKKHGHCLVTPSDGDLELYKWTRSIRKNYKHQFTRKVRQKRTQKNEESSANKHHKTRRPMLSETKANLLKGIDFCWDVQETIWEQRYQQLYEFFEEHGHARIPFQEEDPTLAIWVQNQRRDYRLWLQNLPNPLTPERLQALEELGIFDDYKNRREAWAQHYQYLVEYHQTHGHVDCPQQYMHPVTINVVNGSGEIEERKTTFALGQWCMNQRTARRRWDRLQEDHRQEQSSSDYLPQEKKQSPKSKAERASDNSGGTTIMTAERIQLLDALDFPWNVRDARWDNMLLRLQTYFSQNGHLKIPTTDTQNQDLRQWLIYQRHFYKRQRHTGQSSPMTEDRIEAMEEAIPNFSWKATEHSGPTTEDWAQLFSAMRDKGIAPGMRPKQHWFEGINPLKMEVKHQWTEQELIDLWNQESEYDDDEDMGDISLDYNLDEKDLLEEEEAQVERPASKTRNY